MIKYGKPYIFETGPVNGPMLKTRVTPAKQCKCKHIMSEAPCQGCEGHKGPCWAYRPDGWLLQWNLPVGCSSSTPPGHDNYISPEIMIRQMYQTFYKKKYLNLKAYNAAIRKINVQLQKDWDDEHNN